MKYRGDSVSSCTYCGCDLWQFTGVPELPGQSAIQCVKCKATGPAERTKAQAVRSWNRRVATPSMFNAATHAVLGDDW